MTAIAIIGGTGVLGSGLARRWAAAGHGVTIGSRDPQRARKAAADVNDRLGRDAIGGLGNAQAAAGAEIAVLTVPYASHGAILNAINDAVQGKIVIDATVPLMPPKVRRVHLPPGGSVAKAAQDRLGDGVRVVSALQTVAADRLAGDGALHGDVLVCGNDVKAREIVVSLVESLGLKGWHAGPLDNAVVAESLVPALIFINARYKLDGAGIRIVGERKPDAKRPAGP